MMSNKGKDEKNKEKEEEEAQAKLTSGLPLRFGPFHSQVKYSLSKKFLLKYPDFGQFFIPNSRFHQIFRPNILKG